MYGMPIVLTTFFSSGTIRQWLRPFDLSEVAPCDISIRYSKAWRRTPLVRRIEKLQKSLRSKTKKNPRQYSDVRLNESVSIDVYKEEILNEQVE